MHRALRRAGRVLAAGVALGLAPAMASPLLGSSSPNGQAEAATRLVRGAAPAALSAAQVRWVEMNVELALLADELTCPCPLTVHLHNGQLDIQGAAPNESARARAIQIGSQFGVTQVRDRMKMDHSIASPTVPTASLEKTAVSLLNRRMGAKAAALQVVAVDNGRLSISGQIGSFEEKLALSRILRQTPGCKAVQNEVQVGVVPFQGRNYQRVSQDGKLTVDASRPAVTTSYSIQVAPPPTPAPMAQTPPASPYHLNGGTDDHALPKLPTAPTAPSQKPDNLSVRGDRTEKGSGGIVSTSYQTTSAPPSDASGSARIVPVAEGASLSTQEGASQRPMRGLLMRLFAPGTPSEPVEPAQPAKLVPVPAPIPSVPTTVVPKSELPKAVVGDIGAKPVAPTAGNSKPHVTNGVVFFEDKVVAPQPHTMVVSQSDLKNRVLAATAGKCRQADVVVGPNKATIIQVTVTSEAQELELRQKILQFPEMQTPGVSLEIIITK
jgi:osmotically-inducible protein OsmY